jgi:hypothetical protein
MEWLVVARETETQMSAVDAGKRFAVMLSIGLVQRQRERSRRIPR